MHSGLNRIRLFHVYHDENLPFWPTRLQFQTVWKIWTVIHYPWFSVKKFKTHFFLNHSTNKKVLVLIQNNNHSIMQFSLGRRKGSKSSTHWCSPKSLCESHQSCDRHRLSPRNRYHTWSLCIRLKEILWATNTSKIVCLIYWTRKKKSFLMICLFLSLINQ